MAFNEHISSMRVRVEHLNGILKGRWACLCGIRTQIKVINDFNLINEMIQAVLTLHNIALSLNDEWNDVIDEDNSQNDGSNLSGMQTQSGTELRNRLKSIFESS